MTSISLPNRTRFFDRQIGMKSKNAVLTQIYLYTLYIIIIFVPSKHSAYEQEEMKDYKSMYKVLLVSLVCTIFASYPNLLFLSWDLNCVAPEHKGCYIDNTLIRFLLFWLFTLGTLLFNQRMLKTVDLKGRVFPNILLTILAFFAYKGITKFVCSDFDCRPIILNFQFTVMGMMGLLLGYTSYLNDMHKKKEEELHQLQIESLESRCTALTNQINPHFFFNSLNGISSLVRKKDDKLTIDYINHLSDIFRYVLQSEHKGLVTLEEELDFARSFCDVMQVRYAGKLDVDIDVPNNALNLKIPVLALLPLIENVTVHNMIDSEHRMRLEITLTSGNELVVSNPIYPKQYKPETHGTGLKNLQKRFAMLMEQKVKIEETDNVFKVTLPLAPTR